MSIDYYGVADIYGKIEEVVQWSQKRTFALSAVGALNYLFRNRSIPYLEGLVHNVFSEVSSAISECQIALLVVFALTYGQS